MIAILFLAWSASAEVFTSPLPSTVMGISIPNTHLIAKERGTVLRGMAPLSVKQVQELGEAGVTDILVFRDITPGEDGVLDKKTVLQASPAIRRVHEIPFKWKDLNEFEEPCRQILMGLKLIRDTLRTKNRKLFFHCTVGEDRTGLLAGLYRVVFQGRSAEQAFQNEMCGYGYAEADFNKPGSVSETVHANLTPLYLKMVAMYEMNLISPMLLDEEMCVFEPQGNHPPEEFRCPVLPNPQHKN